MSKYILFIFVFQFVTITVFAQEPKEETKNEAPELITCKELECLRKKKNENWSVEEWINETERKTSKTGKTDFPITKDDNWETKPLPYALPKDVEEWCKEINVENKNGNDTIVIIKGYSLLTIEEWKKYFQKDDKSVWPKGMVNMNVIKEAAEAKSLDRKKFKSDYDKVFQKLKLEKKEQEYSEQEFYDMLKRVDDNKEWDDDLSIKVQDGLPAVTVKSCLNGIAISVYNGHKLGYFKEFWGIHDIHDPTTYYTFECEKKKNVDAQYLLKTNLKNLKPLKSSAIKSEATTHFRLKYGEPSLIDGWFKIVRDNPEKLKEYSNQIETIIDAKIKEYPDKVIKSYQGNIPADWKEEPFFKYYAEGLSKK
jgi:hypothetical protein